MRAWWNRYNGLTIPELIEFLLSLPKAEHEDDIGEVWVRNDRNNPFISNLCYTASKLNKNDVLLGMDSRIADFIKKREEEEKEE